MTEALNINSVKDLPICFQEAVGERTESIEEVKSLSKEDIIKHQIGWELGDEEWYNVLVYWLDKFDLEITEKD